MMNFFGPLNYLGVGNHCYNIVKAYEALGREVCIIPPFGNIGRRDEHIDRWLEKRKWFSPQDPSVMIFDIPFFPNFAGRPRIGFAVFETDGFTELQLAALESCDHLFVPSEWGAMVLGTYEFDNVSVVNEGFDPDVFPVQPFRPNGIFTFAHVGKFEVRKGTIEAVRCFTRAIEDKEAQMLMHVDNPFMPNSDEVSNMLAGEGYRTFDGRLWRRNGLRILLTDPQDAPLSFIWGNADCGLFPTRGEGWGLPLLEAIASGVPIISGRWSAMSEYIKMEYPGELLLKEESRVVAEDGRWFLGDRGKWYEPSDLEIMERIRWAFENARALRASDPWKTYVKWIRERFTWQNAALAMDAAIERVK